MLLNQLLNRNELGIDRRESYNSINVQTEIDGHKEDLNITDHACSKSICIIRQRQIKYGGTDMST